MTGRNVQVCCLERTNGHMRCGHATSRLGTESNSRASRESLDFEQCLISDTRAVICNFQHLSTNHGPFDPRVKRHTG